jgi:hypothetical protein
MARFAADAVGDLEPRAATAGRRIGVATQAGLRVLGGAQAEPAGYGLGAGFGQHAPGPAVVAGRAAGVLPGDQFVLAHDQTAGDLAAMAHRITARGDALVHAALAAEILGLGEGRRDRRDAENSEREQHR